MAARTGAAALSSPVWCLFLFVFVCLLLDYGTAITAYSRRNLIDLGLRFKLPVTARFHQEHNIPVDITRPPGSPWVVSPPGKRRRRRRERKQKRGCRSGSEARLRKQPHRPALPSIFLSNARSIAHKIDELELQMATNSFVRNCSVIFITETWLHPLIPDAAVELAGRTLHRQDRDRESGKSRGGGLCVYVHNEWSCNSRTIDKHCSPDLEALTVSCRPFYLPREFTVVIAIAVYIPPDANVSTALTLLLGIINKQLLAHPEGVFIVAGDFNQACLKSVLPKFVQFVKFATRGENTLDHVYSNIKHAYKATPLPHLAGSDHLCLSLTPTYTPLRRQTKPTTKTLTTWPEAALPQLQDCFSNTIWDIFFSQDLQEHVDTVLSFIRNCISNVTVTKKVRIFPNQKPWMNSEVQSLLRHRNTAFKTRDRDRPQYTEARSALKRGIREAKLAYKRKIEDYFAENDSRKMWQGINHITNYRSRNQVAARTEASLAEELNLFFARFETDRTLAATSSSPPLPPTTTGTLSLQEHEVRRVLRTVNPRKAAGPDGVPGKVLRACADQLSGVFTRIFNQSLAQGIIPACLKTSSIIPVPKKSAADSLNDYRPVALTPVIMKCFERLVSQHIRACLPPTLDPHQFAYRANRSTEDAITIALHSALSHLEHRGSYVRLLFLDFSSAFNNIIPGILVQKLLHLGLSTSICQWIMDFLTDRPQSVRLGTHCSSTITLSTGSPQGCVLSPLLFTLYTSDCIPTHPSNTIIKFADDTTVVGLISGEDESDYRDEVKRLTTWCSVNNLPLNTTKTKEVILDFRKGRADPAPLYINGDSVERVHSIRFLGVQISKDLSWSTNTAAAVKKAQQRLHFLRVLRRNNLEEKLLVTFYRATIESILTYCITAWYAGCTAADRRALQRIINTAQKITGCPLPSLEDIASSRYLSRAEHILSDSSHPSNHLFEVLPSGRRFRSHKARTSRLRDSFFHRAIHTVNNKRTQNT